MELLNTRVRAVTWSRNAGPEHIERARAIAEQAGLTLIERQGAWSTETPVLVVSRSGLCVRRGSETFRWHPGMLHARRAAGFLHPLVRLTHMRPGHTVLDATMGQGTDARFLSELLGRTVRGVELSPVVAMMTAEGLRGVDADVEVICRDGRDVLEEAPACSWDHVLFDPMFPAHPPGARRSPSLNGLRAMAHTGGVDAGWVRAARRVARWSVVVRDVEGSGLLEDLDPPHVWHRRGRPARYGVWSRWPRQGA